MKHISINERERILNEIEIIQSHQILKEERNKGESLHDIKIVYKNENLRFLLLIPSQFPYQQPSFFTFKEELKNLPHIMDEVFNLKGICYADSETILLDVNNPKGILESACLLTCQTYEKSLFGQNARDYLSEFYYYWGKFKDDVAISIVPNLNKVQLIHAKTFKANSKIKTILGLEPNVIDLFASKSIGTVESTSEEAFLYIPLKGNKRVSFKNGTWSIKDLQDFITNNLNSYTNLNLLKGHLKKDKDIPLFISFPSIDRKSQIQIAVRFRRKPYQKKHPLFEKKHKSNMKTIAIQRNDIEYLTTRGGASSKLHTKNICLIGCGALGSLIAIELVKSGITSITLIDKDIFSEDNLYRHVLGYDSIGQSKTDALKVEIERKNPLTNIISYPKEFIETVNENLFEKQKYDVIINATGNDNTGMMIEDYLMRDCTLNKTTPIVHTWIEPLGIGGHSLLVNNAQDGGCLKCLYKATETSLYNRASFVAENQSISKSLSGCVGNFTPYSSIDAQRTSIQTVELILNTLLEKTQGNPMISWKGSKDGLENQGYTVSKRYLNLTDEELFEKRYEYKNPNCVCIKKSA